MASDYRDNYYGSILDPLHGDIKLSEIEKWTISQPIFSRLRRVKQNTFLYYVFPSANHTRFEHSIGVMHLAGKIFDSCKENFATGKKKREKYSLDQETSFFDLNNLSDKEAIYYQELRLSALLHDIGHGPLSHLFDEFAISKGIFLELIKKSETLKAYETSFQKLIEDNKDKVEHEIISCAFIFLLIEELKKDSKKFSPSAQLIISHISAERIVKLVEPEFRCAEKFEDKAGNNYDLFFSRIISAFPIDADRMDYLLRDSYFSGVTYGIYDINRIFSSFMATGEGKKVLLTYKESGLDSMLRFIQSRSHLYNQVYFHKTNRAANTMLYAATAKGREKSIKLLDTRGDIFSLRDFYIRNSDEVFINETVLNDIVENTLEKDVLKELLERRLFKRVYQAKVVLREAEFENKVKLDEEIDKIKAIRKAIDEKLTNLVSVYAVTDLYANITFKDAKAKSIRIAIKAENKYRFEEEWKNVNKEFALMNMDVLMIRVYIRRTFTDSKDFEAKKKIILDTISAERTELEKYAG